METDKIALQRVCHPRLSSETEWTALGDVSLLDAPLRVPVILSRSLKPNQIAAAYQQLEAAVRRGAVVVGGFVSPAEKQVARQLARFPDLKLIRVVPFSLYNYPLTASVKARIQQGTTLLLSGCPAVVQTITRANCVRANGWIQEICRDNAPESSTQSVIDVCPSAPIAPKPIPAPVTSKPSAFTPENDPAAIFL